ncbi:hypothetical protein Agub_g14157, partial [Astrephomene gubernaculifera]
HRLMRPALEQAPGRSSGVLVSCGGLKQCLRVGTSSVRRWRAGWRCGWGCAANPAAEALHAATLILAPALLGDFCRRRFQRMSWDERTAYGVLELAEVMAGGEGGGATNAEYGKALAGACGGWLKQVLPLLSGDSDSGSNTGGGNDGSATTRPLDEQLVLLAAACVACRTARAASAAAVGVAVSLDCGRLTAGAASVCDLEPSTELSATFSGGGGGGSSSGGNVRLELLPAFIELKWRLVGELLATAAGGDARELPRDVREALCERALQDLDCAPDAALSYILDTLYDAAPYDDVLRAVSATAAATMASSSSSAAAAACGSASGAPPGDTESTHHGHEEASTLT